MGPGSSELALPPCVTLGRSLPLSEPYSMVGMGQSTSEDSSALLLGFLKPHPAHTPDSCVTMGQAVSPWASVFYPCSAVISLVLLGVSWEWGLHPGPGWVAKRG